MCAVLAYTIPFPAFYTEILVNGRLGQNIFLNFINICVGVA